MKTKYTDTNKAFTYFTRFKRLYSQANRAKESEKDKNIYIYIVIMIMIIWSRSCLSDSMAFAHYARIIFSSILVRQKH